MLTRRTLVPSMDTTFAHFGLSHASQQMLHRQLFTDAVLIVEGHQIAVHRAVLAANSPVFNQLFSCQMTEGITACAVLFCTHVLSHLECLLCSRTLTSACLLEMSQVVLTAHGQQLRPVVDTLRLAKA